LRGKYASEGPDKSIEPLHVFGEGLSYTSFAYSELKAPLMIKAGEGVRLSVKVTNTGKRQGEEVVMLFRSYPVNPVTTPERLLTDFKRISLPAGESCVVELAVQPEQLTLLNNKLQPQAPIGKFIFTLGNNLMSKEITVK
jgi:beta-glucosidase